MDREPLIRICPQGHASTTMILTKQHDEQTEMAEVTIQLACRRCDDPSQR